MCIITVTNFDIRVFNTCHAESCVSNIEIRESRGASYDLSEYGGSKPLVISRSADTPSVGLGRRSISWSRDLTCFHRNKRLGRFGQLLVRE